MICITYIGLDYDLEKYFNNLHSELDELKNEFDVFAIPQIGLFMTQDGKPSTHCEEDVANGKLDKKINDLIKGIQSLERPVYLRIGYECNGVPWNGYQPKTYVEDLQGDQTIQRLSRNTCM